MGESMADCSVTIEKVKAKGWMIASWRLRYNFVLDHAVDHCRDGRQANASIQGATANGRGRGKQR